MTHVKRVVRRMSQDQHKACNEGALLYHRDFLSLTRMAPTYTRAHTHTHVSTRTHLYKHTQCISAHAFTYIHARTAQAPTSHAPATAARRAPPAGAPRKLTAASCLSLFVRWPAPPRWRLWLSPGCQVSEGKRAACRGIGASGHAAMCGQRVHAGGSGCSWACPVSESSQDQGWCFYHQCYQLVCTTAAASACGTAAAGQGLGGNLPVGIRPSSSSSSPAGMAVLWWPSTSFWPRYPCQVLTPGGACAAGGPQRAAHPHRLPSHPNSLLDLLPGGFRQACCAANTLLSPPPAQSSKLTFGLASWRTSASMLCGEHPVKPMPASACCTLARGRGQPKPPERRLLQVSAGCRKRGKGTEKRRKGRRRHQPTARVKQGSAGANGWGQGGGWCAGGWWQRSRGGQCPEGGHAEDD